MALNLPHASYRKGDIEYFYSESVPPNTSLILERLQWGGGGMGLKTKKIHLLKNGGEKVNNKLH